MKYKQLLLFFAILPPALLVGGCGSATSSEDITDPEDPNLPREGKGLSALCEDGLAGDTYSCKNIDLAGHLTADQLMGVRLNDIWGWTDPQSGVEYALVGLSDRVTFVDLSVPDDPRVIATLPEVDTRSKKGGSFSTGVAGHAGHDDEDHDDEGKSSAWRDIKVFKDHVYIVSDGQPHGLQIFDLTRLREITDPPAAVTEDVHFTEFDNAHNIAINEETGFAYVVGSDRVGGGLYILDISSPKSPVEAGFHADSTVGFGSTGYVHDTQCVVYEGPDPDYTGREICFNSSETHFVVADVSDKEATATISKSDFSGSGYIHQGWLTEDHRYFLLDDELDERRDGGSTTTYIWDVSDLDDPKLIGSHAAETGSIDHNQYIKGGLGYQANYTTGLRILNLSNIASGSLEEVAFFDTFPEGDDAVFNGAWSNYPFFESGLVIVSDMSNGLFVLQPTLTEKSRSTQISQ